MILKFKNLNPERLASDLDALGMNIAVNSDLIFGKNIASNVWIEVDENIDVSIIQSIVDAHDPTPLPLPLSEVEKLRVEQAQANAELIQLIMMTGGGFE